MKLSPLLVFLVAIIAWPCWAQSVVTAQYKVVDGHALELEIHKPQGHSASDKRPAIVFFHGGGWRGGSADQFDPHCRHLADRGMVAITVTYRLKNTHGTTPAECVKDARSAMRWVRKYAHELGIDPERIAAGGGSAGGHLALSTTLLPGPDEDTDDTSVSPAANALVLFNPATNTANLPARFGMGDKGKIISPQHHVRADLPPGIQFHGTADETVPHFMATQFEEAMKEADNDFALVSYEGAGHGFFNFDRNDGKYYALTVQEMDAFLTRSGYLPTK